MTRPLLADQTSIRNILEEWVRSGRLSKGCGWSERGVEYSADVIAWGLLDDAAPMVRIGNRTCDELTASFKLLTATDPLRADCTGT